MNTNIEKCDKNLNSEILLLPSRSDNLEVKAHCAQLALLQAAPVPSPVSL